MADDLALDEAGLVGDEDQAAPVAQDLAIALHRRDAPLDPLPFFIFGDTEPSDQLVVGQWDPGFLEDFEGLLAGGDGNGIGLYALGFVGQCSFHKVKFRVFRAQMAELVDAPVSGTGG